MDDPFGLQSRLDMQASLGVSDRLLAGKSSGLGESGRFDNTQWDESANPAKFAANSWLVPPAVESLCSMLPADGSHELEFRYAVEPVGTSLSRPHALTSKYTYRLPEPDAHTQLLYSEAPANPVTKGSEAQAHTASTMLIMRQNAWGVASAGGNQLTYLAQQRGPEATGIFVVMWLMQLDVVSGAQVGVDGTNNDLRLRVPVGTPLHEEAQLMGSVSGIRLHADALTGMMQALLYGATHRASVTGLSPWVRRYRWLETPVTLYGGPAHAMLRQPYVFSGLDANVGAHMAGGIVDMANRYDLREQCRVGYETALFLYGNICTNARVRLRCSAPVLYHELHQRSEPIQQPSMVWGMNNKQLPAAALFLGVALAQGWRDIYRGTVRVGYRVRDKPQLRRVLDSIDDHALCKVTAAAMDLCRAYLTPCVSEKSFIRSSLLYAWQARGVLHGMVAGFAVEGGIMSSVYNPILAPHEDELLGTDLVQCAWSRGDAERRAWLLSSLLTDGGARLKETLAEAMPHTGTTINLHYDLRSYCGQTMEFVPLGFGNRMQLTFRAHQYVEMPPAVVDVERVSHAPPNTVTVVESTAVDAELRAEKREKLKTQVVAGGDLLADIMGMTGVRTSTLFKRRDIKRDQAATAQPRRYAGPQGNYGRAVEVAAADDHVRNVVACAIEEDGTGPQETSGEGLMCGVHALQQSLEHLGDERSRNTEELRNIVLDAFTPEERSLLDEWNAPDAGGHGVVNNFSADQLTRAAAAIGRQLIIIEAQGQGNPTAYSLADKTAGEPLLVYHNGHGHWEGWGQNDGRMRLSVKSAVAGTPAVEHKRTYVSRRHAQRGKRW
jgi:hypothetical protein